jgi:hypothetical protein
MRAISKTPYFDLIFRFDVADATEAEPVFQREFRQLRTFTHDCDTIVDCRLSSDPYCPAGDPC